MCAHAVTDLLKATPEEEILRRDIYERAPMFKWADGEPGSTEGLVGRLAGWPGAAAAGGGRAVPSVLAWHHHGAARTSAAAAPVHLRMPDPLCLTFAAQAAWCWAALHWLGCSTAV